MYFQNLITLPSHCTSAWFENHLVGNLKDWVSHNEAHVGRNLKDWVSHNEAHVGRNLKDWVSHNEGRDMTKPVFRVSDKVRFKSSLLCYTD